MSAYGEYLITYVNENGWRRHAVQHSESLPAAITDFQDAHADTAMRIVAVEECSSDREHSA